MPVDEDDDDDCRQVVPYDEVKGRFCLRQANSLD
jgi:hypothetical protein